MAPTTDEIHSNANVESAAVASNKATATDPPPAAAAASKQVVCRFLVKNISAAKLVPVDLSVDLLVNRDGLFDLVLVAFKHGFQKLGNSSDSYYSHLWDVTFDNVLYKNGWRGNNPVVAGDPMARCHIDDISPRILNSLPKPVAVGQKGSFAGESGSFDFVVQSLTDVTDKGKPDTDYHIAVKQVELNLTSEIKCDFLSNEQIQQAMRLREAHAEFYRGDNEWKRDTRGKPVPPPWGRDELTLLGLVINADAKFKKSFAAILQYGLIGRPEPATSGQWYKLKKEEYRREYTGRGLSAKQQIVAAKQLVQKLLERAMDTPVPTLGPKPPSYYERSLLEMCDDSDYDSDTATPVAKRAKVLEMRERHRNGELGEAAQYLPAEY